MEITIFRFDEKQAEKYAESISALIKSSFAYSFPNNNTPDEYFAERPLLLRSYIAESKAAAFGAVNECGELVGILWCYIQTGAVASVVHIVHYSVDSRLRGKGIGKRLMQECEEYATSNGIFAIECIVTASNTDSVAAYKKMGYEISRYVMRKEL